MDADPAIQSGLQILVDSLTRISRASILKDVQMTQMRFTMHRRQLHLKRE